MVNEIVFIVRTTQPNLPDLTLNELQLFIS